MLVRSSQSYVYKKPPGGFGTTLVSFIFTLIDPSNTIVKHEVLEYGVNSIVGFTLLSIISALNGALKHPIPSVPNVLTARTQYDPAPIVVYEVLSSRSPPKAAVASP